MKKDFSNAWKGSRLPRKQRKYRAKAPHHVKQKMLSAHLSKDLRQKYGRRGFQVKKGDTVKIMGGEYHGKTGKINEINFAKLKVAIEGIQITKRDGSKANVYTSPSKLMITELNIEDRKRLDSINKTSAKTGKTEEKK